MINLTTGVLYAKTPSGLVDLGVVGTSGSGLPKFEGQMLFGKASPWYFEEGHIIHNFSAVNFIKAPSSQATTLTPLVIDYSKPWEIGVCLMFKTLPTKNVAIIGGNEGYYEFPSVEIDKNGRIWFGISGDNSTWGANISTNIQDFKVDTWYIIVVGVDENEMYVKYTEDFYNYVGNSKEATVVQHDPSDGKQLSFGCNAGVSTLAATMIKIDLFNLYVKNDGNIIWGAAKYSG